MKKLNYSLVYICQAEQKANHGTIDGAICTHFSAEEQKHEKLRTIISTIIKKTNVTDVMFS